MCLYTSTLVSEGFCQYESDSNREKSVHLKFTCLVCHKNTNQPYQFLTGRNIKQQRSRCASPAKASLNVPDAVDKPERIGVEKPISKAAVTPWPGASDSFLHLQSPWDSMGYPTSTKCYNVYNVEASEASHCFIFWGTLLNPRNWTPRSAGSASEVEGL